MLCHAIAPSRRFVKASHDVVRHPRLSSDAKILLLYVQGLPDDRTALALSEHARRIGITGRTYQKAKEQLVAHGFVHEWRRQGGQGRWVTDQLLANVPLTGEQAALVRDGAAVLPRESPSTRKPAVGLPRPRTAGDSLPVDEEREKNAPHPPSEAPPAEEPPERPEPEAPPMPEVAFAEGVLLSLRHAQPQLHLGVREARGLAEAAAEWIRRGVGAGELRRVLTSELPGDGVRSAVGFLRHRLVQKLPEAVKPKQADEPSGGALVLCEGPGGEHAFRPTRGDQTRCARCRAAEARTDDRPARAATAPEDAPQTPWRERVAAFSDSTASTASTAESVPDSGIRPQDHVTVGRSDTRLTS